MTNDLTCAEIEELLPGYVFDALGESQRCEFAAHLVDCRTHDAELQASRVAASRLPGAVGPIAPPTALRDKLLGAFDRESQPGAPAPIGPRRRLPSLREHGMRYALAASVVIALALGAWGISRGGSAAEVHSTTTSAGRLEVIYVSDKQLAVIDFDLPALPSGRTYQAWGQVNGAMVSLGVLAPNGPAVLRTDLGNTDLVAVSIEPSGGSDQPTTDPVISTRL